MADLLSREDRPVIQIDPAVLERARRPPIGEHLAERQAIAAVVGVAAAGLVKRHDPQAVALPAHRGQHIGATWAAQPPTTGVQAAEVVDERRRCQPVELAAQGGVADVPPRLAEDLGDGVRAMSGREAMDKAPGP